ncbi:MAG: hypothetical protein AAGD13_01040 [Pseudomonadota bacterium]
MPAQPADRLGDASLAPITAEQFFTELSKLTIYDQDRADALADRLSDVETVRAFEELDRQITESAR